MGTQILSDVHQMTVVSQKKKKKKKKNYKDKLPIIPAVLSMLISHKM